jgi:hypothetical protein
MKRFFLFLLPLGLVFAFLVSCNPDENQEQSSEDKVVVTNIVVPSSVETEPGETVTIRLRGKAGILTSDAVILKNTAGKEFTMPVVSVDDGKTFSFSLADGVVSDRYSFYIVHGGKNWFCGSIDFTVVKRVEIEPKAGMTVYGLISCDGIGVPNVVVSDGIEVTTTDENGVYYLKSNKKYNYVWYSVPGAYEPETMGYDKKPGGILPVIYQRLDGIPGNTQRVDFNMVKAPETDSYTLFILGDIHLANRSNTGDMAQFRTFATEFNQTVASTPGRRYALTLGDMSWDIYWYELKFGLSNYVKEMDTDVKDIAIYHTMGNHDNDFKMYGDFDKEEDYRDVLAPTFYSYNIGKVHYVVLDDIDYTGVEASGFDASGKLVAPDNRGKYTENFTTEQLDWLRKDLSYVSKSTPIVLSAHAPVYRPNGVNAFKAGLGTSRGYGKTAQLESVLSGYKVHIFTGHTHKTFNYDRYSTNGIFEHNAGSVCGSWWWSGHYVNGINLAQDGAPGGYTILKVNGTDFSWVYKSTGYDPSYQFRAYDMNEVKKVVTNGKYPSRENWETFANAVQAFPANTVLLNIWNYDPSWKISVTENGKELTCFQIETYDPLHIISESAFRDSFNTSKWIHHFRVYASSPTSTLEIKVTDRFGNVYTETMTRPKNFNASVYK